MDNEDAIKDIVKETCEGCFYIESCRREDCAFYLAIEALRWIPVSEKLPEKDGRFLICTSSGDVDTNVFMFGRFTRPYVIAWKHLPEPYDWRTENE